jgi:predicted nucleic acid-binding protein
MPAGVRQRLRSPRTLTRAGFRFPALSCQKISTVALESFSKSVRPPATDEEAARVLRDLRRFEIFETGGVELAVAAARHYRSLRARGRTVRKTIHCLIATFCLRGGHSALHCDRDFDPFEQLLGLSVVHPRAERPDAPDEGNYSS